jgi:acyl-CoA synthetase (AMP-forming)/AMP-acid ligase II
MDGPPPVLKLSGPPKTDRHVTVAELSNRLKMALSHKSITNNQRRALEMHLSAMNAIPNKEALWFIPEILITVEAMPRPPNGGARRRSLKKRSGHKRTLRKKRTHRK